MCNTIFDKPFSDLKNINFIIDYVQFENNKDNKDDAIGNNLNCA